MSRLWLLARRHGFDVLIVLVALESASEVAIRHDAVRAPTTPLWFAIPASACGVLPLLGRRRFPFAAPAGPRSSPGDRARPPVRAVRAATRCGRIS